MNYSMFVDELLSQSIVTFILKVWGVTPGSYVPRTSEIWCKHIQVHYGQLITIDECL